MRLNLSVYISNSFPKETKHKWPFDRFPCADRDSLHRKVDMKKVLMPGGDGRIVGDMVLHRKHDRMVAAVALDHSMV